MYIFNILKRDLKRKKITNIVKDEMPHVFESFYRGTNVGKEEGSGLGLYICQRLMHQMKGDIFVCQEQKCFVATVVVRMG